MNNTLKSVFEKAKHYGGVAKDKLLNAGDRMLAGQEVIGNAQAGAHVEVNAVFAKAETRAAERNTARAAAKKQNPYLR